MAEATELPDAIVLLGFSVMGAWLSDLVRETAARADPPVEFHLGDADHVLEDLGRAEGPPRVLAVVGPGRKVMDTIIGRRARVLAVIDDPADSVRFTRATKDVDFVHAMRDQTRVASAHGFLLDNPVVRLLQRGTLASAREVIETVLSHLGLALTAEQRETVLTEFGGPAAEKWSLEAALRNKVSAYASLDRVSDVISASEVAIIREVLSPMVRAALTRDIGPITWSRPVFLLGDPPHGAAPPLVDLTGGARIIFFGPYFHLPQGEWMVRLIVAFSKEVRGEPFTIKIWCQQQLAAQAAMRPADAGAFECTFRMRHLRPEGWLEIHFCNEEGVLEGSIALGQMDFKRVDQPV